MNDEKSMTLPNYNGHQFIEFSIYTSIQVKYLLIKSDIILNKLDQSINFEQTGKVDATNLEEIYGEFWLWILGVFEVLRTISQHEDCFKPESIADIKEFKKKIAILRVPFSKQEFKGKNKIIINEISIFSLKEGDLLFKVKDTTYSVKELISEFTLLISSFDVNDINKRIN